jgi:hypothetical protein
LRLLSGRSMTKSMYLENGLYRVLLEPLAFV